MCMHKSVYMYNRVTTSYTLLIEGKFTLIHNLHVSFDCRRFSLVVDILKFENMELLCNQKGTL